jgi:hypothetical protein
LGRIFGDHRLAAHLRVIAPFHGRAKRIHLEMKDHETLRQKITSAVGNAEDQ